jgi:hypothetical protein
MKKFHCQYYQTDIGCVTGSKPFSWWYENDLRVNAPERIEKIARKACHRVWCQRFIPDFVQGLTFLSKWLVSWSEQKNSKPTEGSTQCSLSSWCKSNGRVKIEEKPTRASSATNRIPASTRLETDTRIRKQGCSACSKRDWACDNSPTLALACSWESDRDWNYLQCRGVHSEWRDYSILSEVCTITSWSLAINFLHSLAFSLHMKSYVSDIAANWSASFDLHHSARLGDQREMFVPILCHKIPSTCKTISIHFK